MGNNTVVFWLPGQHACKRSGGAKLWVGRTVGGDVLSPGSGESPSGSAADPWLLRPPLQKFHSGTQDLLLSEVPVALLDALLAQLLSHIPRHRCTSRLLIYTAACHTP